MPAWTCEVELILQLNVNFGCIWQYNAVYDVAISADEAGIVEYWSGLKNDVQFPKNVNFEYKTDTDLFEFIMVSELSGKFKWHWKKFFMCNLHQLSYFHSIMQFIARIEMPIMCSANACKYHYCYRPLNNGRSTNNVRSKWLLSSQILGWPFIFFLILTVRRSCTAFPKSKLNAFSFQSS